MPSIFLFNVKVSNGLRQEWLTIHSIISPRILQLYSPYYFIFLTMSSDIFLCDSDCSILFLGLGLVELSPGDDSTRPPTLALSNPTAPAESIILRSHRLCSWGHTMPLSETQGCNLIRLNRDLQIPLFPDSHATPLGPGSVNSGLDVSSQIIRGVFVV